jgi:hypothetical protein
MMRLIVFVGALFLSVHTVSGQVDSVLARSWSFSLGANEYSYDTGLGGELASPSIMYGRLCFRIKASTVWMESFRAVNGCWARYGFVEAMAVYQFHAIERARPYIEAGVINVFPSGKFSDVASVQGVGFRTGVELFLFTSARIHVVYYFGGGINSVKAVAEKMEIAPSYADGFTFTTGLRFYIRSSTVMMFKMN